MFKLKKIISVMAICCLLLSFSPGITLSDDTCIFSVTADDAPPYIVLLLDNGAEMEQIIWHENYDPATVYPSAGSIFTSPYGYTLKKSGNLYYLYPIGADLTWSSPGIVSDGGVPTWDINGRVITLPAFPSAAVDASGVKDNAAQFRYATNYLNWLFYSNEYSGNGSDLPSKSRFYYAKQAIMTVAKMTANRAQFGIYYFANTSGASAAQPLSLVVEEPLQTNEIDNTLDPAFINNVNNMGTVTYSPLAEGLASVGGYYASNSSGVVDSYCSQLFTLLITPGISSYDQDVAASSSPVSFSDADGDGDADGLGTTLTVSGHTYTIPTNINGTTYLDDVAAYHYDNDIVGYASGFQRVSTYTLGFMGDAASNAFLKNTSNNGNGNFNLYDASDPEYGKYHYTVDYPDQLADELLAAINAILMKTTVFTAPVVPVTRTTSGDRIYLALFKPDAGNFWEGNLAKYGLASSSSGGVEIVDDNGNPATWPNGALKETAAPFWETKNWADSSKPNYVHNTNRNIYSCLSSNEIVSSANAFTPTQMAGYLGNPTDVTVNGTVVNGVEKVVRFIRGADVFDEDDDGDTDENRSVITGDILHSEPAVITYNNSAFNGSAIFFGANDGMLHAVRDNDGTEMWGFIPTDLLPRLKDIVEGSGHQYYIDASPKVFIKNDTNSVVESGEQAVLVFGERAGGTHYWGLDVTDPNAPKVLWDISSSFALDFGETWSEPVFSLVKMSDEDTTGTAVMFVGGGYSADNSAGSFVAAINVFTGNTVKLFDGLDLSYSIPSAVNVIDLDNNGFADKVYVGDMGGQLIRLGRFTEDDGTTPLGFPETNENINKWQASVVFDTINTRKIFYPPAVTLERDFDMVFFGTGDRNDPCNVSSSDRIYAVTDDHSNTTKYDSDLVDVTSTAAAAPLFPDDGGYFISLAAGEKILSEGMVFNKVFYVSSFITDNSDPCMPGGSSWLYGLSYLSGGAALDFNNDGQGDRSEQMGGGIPSKPVMIITPDGDVKLFVSVGSSLPNVNSEETSAGIWSTDPVLPSRNFFYLWWRELI